MTEFSRFWEARPKMGAPRKYEDADALMSDCLEYFESRGAMRIGDKPAPFTLDSLCLFLEISRGTWNAWRANRQDLSEVIKSVDAAINDQKFSHALVGDYNANLVARSLGMPDKSEITGKGGGPIETRDRTARIENLTPAGLAVLDCMMSAVEPATAAYEAALARDPDTKPTAFVVDEIVKLSPPIDTSMLSDATLEELLAAKAGSVV